MNTHQILEQKECLFADNFDFTLFISHLKDDIMPFLSPQNHSSLETLISALKDRNTIINYKSKYEGRVNPWITKALIIEDEEIVWKICDSRFEFDDDLKVREYRIYWYGECHDPKCESVDIELRSNIFYTYIFKKFKRYEVVVNTITKEKKTSVTKI
jgi:hypothetical protein